MEHRYTVIPSPADTHDYTRGLRLAPSLTRGSLAVNGWLPPVRDQGQEGSCTAFSAAYGRARMRYAHLQLYDPFSPAWFYWQERVREGDTGQDAGAMPRDAMKVLRKQGFCPESVMPYPQYPFAVAPPVSADAAGFPFRITRYLRCHNLDDLKVEIGLRNDVMLAINVNQNFEQGGNNGVIGWNHDKNFLGGHAIWPYEFIDAPGYAGGGYVTFRNSWGSTWAVGGDAHLSYDFFSSPQFMEAWAFE